MQTGQCSDYFVSFSQNAVAEVQGALDAVAPVGEEHHEADAVVLVEAQEVVDLVVADSVEAAAVPEDLAGETEVDGVVEEGSAAVAAAGAGEAHTKNPPPSQSQNGALSLQYLLQHKVILRIYVVWV